MKILSREEFLNKLSDHNAKRNYQAMYSSLVQGCVTDPALMILPIDEHMVHRGDGVFEAIRFSPKKIFLLDAHIERLFRSAEMIGLKPPHASGEVKKICEDLREVSKLKEGILRLFVGRGPGDFTPNPYSTLGAQFYAVVTEFKPLSPELYSNGVKLMISDVPVKAGFYSQVKSCNYLPNVMMKKQTVDRGFDFAINLNESGFVAEGPTENIALVTADGVLCARAFR
jgi:branched-chain amino acid aminotransferase